MKPLAWISRAKYLFVLRSIFLSSAVAWLIFFLIFRDNYTPQNWYWSLLFSSILLHQIVCAFAVPFLHTITDFIWLVFNISGSMCYAFFNYVFEEANPWASQLTLIHAILCFYLFGALPLLALIRLAIISDAGVRTLIQPFDLLAYFQPGWKQDLGGVRVLFGNSLWRSHFIGETKTLIFARGSLAALFLCGITGFSLLRILAEPIRELRLIPTQNIRTPDAYTPIQDSNSNVATWGIIISALNVEPSLFHSAVSVIPLWMNLTDEISNIPISSKPDCVYLESDSDYPTSRQPIFVPELMTYYCPSRIPIEDALSANDILPQPYMIFQPDLLVTVNFTTLGIATDTVLDIPTNSVQIMVAMTNRTADVVLMTIPTTLIPGVNLIGIASMEIHRKFTNPGLSLFGLLESVQSTIIAQINQVFPDPQAGISPLIIRSPEIATIRVSGQVVSTQWTIIQDSKDKSFFNGLSQAGGLWTFLSGIFAVVFGGSLMRILFGTKPVSVFGLAHGWERNAIRKAYREEYPAIAEEINAPQDQRGLLCLLQEHIIDLGLTEEIKQESLAIPEDIELDNFERGPEVADQDQATTGGAR